jgi:hypothetical protein
LTVAGSVFAELGIGEGVGSRDGAGGAGSVDATGNLETLADSEQVDSQAT